MVMSEAVQKNGLIDEMIAKARKAQEAYELFDQNQVDHIVKEMAKVVYDNAEDLARMAVDETGMGVYEDKIKKNQGKAKIIWHSLKGKKSVGIIEKNEKTGIIKVAKPIGVVSAVIPTTNPIVTAMSNTMFAVKGRNAIILAPHPEPKKPLSGQLSWSIKPLQSWTLRKT
jgi:succinate-semialdehyde dehydrogenase